MKFINFQKYNNKFINFINYDDKIDENIFNNNNINIIINVQNNYLKKVKIGLFSICELKNNLLINSIQESKNNIILYTGYKEWLLIRNKNLYNVEIDNTLKKIFICKNIFFDEVLDIFPLKNILSDNEINYFNSIDKRIEKINIIYARCKKSMIFLDNIHRKYLYKYKLKKNNIIAVKSVAGSGKTTTLLELSKIHSDKKILYLAFNKNLITEIKSKITDQKIKNLIPVTFDSLMRNIFIEKKNIEPDIIDIKTQNISQVIPWLESKPYKIKQYYVKWFNKFCQQSEYDDIENFSINIIGNKKPLLKQMWNNTLNNTFHTFDSIRKHVQLNHLSKNYINKKYDIIFIDEAQDFDNIMLKILLDDVKIPRIFVGDPKQAIYEWRGCINAFDKLPKKSIIFEFYSTFRIGNPACEKISSMFNNCWMISKSQNDTILEINKEINEKYVYLFRNWKSLLLSAKTIKKIWIYGFDKQIEYIRKLHNKLQISDLSEEEKNEFSDDLPAFLIKMTCDELEDLLKNIKNNIVNKEDSICQLYTIHSYKGLENDNIRIYDDIDIINEQNLYYVALTRGLKNIILDKNENKNENENENENKIIINTNNKLQNTIKKINKNNKILLNPNTSWVKYTNNIPTKLKNNNLSFEQLWNLHPEKKGIIKIYGKEIETPRWQQSYGLSYNFSGTTNIALEIPDEIQKYINYANEIDNTEGEFNMALVNWYENGNHYIGEHSDDESQLIKNSPIYCFSFGEERDFILINKKNREDKEKILLENNSLIIMGGTCQKTHRHTLPKRLRKKNKRISITLRKFK